MEGMKQGVLAATGLSSSIGQALLKRLPADMPVVSLGRTASDDPRVVHFFADFRRPASEWRVPLTTYLAEHDCRVAGFIHLAGLVFSDVSESTRAGEWDDMLGVNLGAAFFVGQALSPFWSAGAAVVLMGSVDAYKASSDGPAAAYGAAKAGLVGLMRHWAAEWGPRGVRVNGIGLGAMETALGPASAGVAASVAGRTALRRLARAEEAAAVVQFLLSDDASYITGAWIPVDGGLNLSY
jgi:NAD(P)-dependent dehydrogenase (short-subunit alcohol dehydrogenase family)